MSVYFVPNSRQLYCDAQVENLSTDAFIANRVDTIGQHQKRVAEHSLPVSPEALSELSDSVDACVDVLVSLCHSNNEVIARAAMARLYVMQAVRDFIVCEST